MWKNQKSQTTSPSFPTSVVHRPSINTVQHGEIVNMDEDGIIVVLVFYCLTSLHLVPFTLIALRKKKQWIGRLRVLATAPYLIHGVVAVHLFDGIRKSSSLAHETDLLFSTGIKACIVSSYCKGYLTQAQPGN
jgi:hypothetical protein